MSSKAPPAPPANRSPKGTGDDKRAPVEQGPATPGPDQNLAEQGRQGNIRQNTTNQGHQQDR